MFGRKRTQPDLKLVETEVTAAPAPQSVSDHVRSRVDGVIARGEQTDKLAAAVEATGHASADAWDKYESAVTAYLTAHDQVANRIQNHINNAEQFHGSVVNDATDHTLNDEVRLLARALGQDRKDHSDTRQALKATAEQYITAHEAYQAALKDAGVVKGHAELARSSIGKHSRSAPAQARTADAA